MKGLENDRRGAGDNSQPSFRRRIKMDKEAIKDALNQASNMYPYEVEEKPETYSLYNAGWQDTIDYVSQLLGVDIDTADF